MMAFFAALLLALLALPLHAQQIIPVRDSERQYITFVEAAPLIFAAAVERAKPPSTDSGLTVAMAYERLLEFAKHSAVKVNIDHVQGGFSYLAFLPSLAGGKIEGETIFYTFGYGTVSVAAGRDPGAFSYRIKKDFESEWIPAPNRPGVRIYKHDKDFTFRSIPEFSGSTLIVKALCTSTSAACYRLDPYTLGRYKWYRVDTGRKFMVACNDVSDCLQAYISYDFYVKTFNLGNLGYDYSSQYYGEYMVRPSSNCVDSLDFASYQILIPGLACVYSIQYDRTFTQYDTGFTVYGSHEAAFLDYLSLLPVPVSCPGMTKYYQLLACDARFQNDVISPKSLAFILNKMFWWGSQRVGYRGIQYTPITVGDVHAALGAKLVKVSSMAEIIPGPKLGSIPGGFVGDEMTPVPPGTGYNPVTGTDEPSPGVSLDLGPDPQTAAPALESDPGGSSLSSIWSMFPSLRAFTPGVYSVQCPTFTPNIFGTVLHVDAHCQVVESQRLALGVLSLVAWASTALLVVLRA